MGTAVRPSAIVPGSITECAIGKTPENYEEEKNQNKKTLIIMRNVVQFMHVSLDGFAAGPNGEMNWISIDNEMFDFVHERTNISDAALYGRKTWELMDGYWPTAADKPNASKHDIDHGKWYNGIDKYVLSRTMKSDPSKKVKVIGKDLEQEIKDIKNGPGKEILIFGSPSAGHALSRLGMVDEYWLFVNPILIGKGIPMFDGQKEITKLKLEKSHTFKSGVIALYHKK
jgi:dihydrofolate reductase